MTRALVKVIAPPIECAERDSSLSIVIELRCNYVIFHIVSKYVQLLRRTDCVYIQAALRSWRTKVPSYFSVISYCNFQWYLSAKLP